MKRELICITLVKLSLSNVHFIKQKCNRKDILLRNFQSGHLIQNASARWSGKGRQTRGW